MVSRKFCCCIPVRLGVFIMSILGFAGGSIIAGVGWYATAHRDQTHFTRNQEISIVITSLSHTVLAAISLFGFIGAITKRRGFVSLFSTMLFIHLGVSIATGVFFIWSLFHKAGEQSIDNCVSGSTTESECQSQFNTTRRIIIAVYILIWLFEFWGCIIVTGYISQLRTEETIFAADIMAPSSTPMATTYNAGSQYAFSQPRSSVIQRREASNNV